VDERWAAEAGLEASDEVLGEFFALAGFDEVDGGPSPAGAGELGAEESGGLLGGLDEGIEFGGAVFEVVAAGGVGFGHEASERSDVAGAEGVDALADAVVFAKDVPCAAAGDGVEGIPCGVEVGERDVAEVADLGGGVEENALESADVGRGVSGIFGSGG
jgi:hypothetical protein